MTTERERFMARFLEARKAGLVDVKFFFHPAKAMKPEDVFAAMNEVEDACERNAKRHRAWNGNNAADVLET